MIDCIIVDDEPIGRRGMKRLVENDGRLNLLGMFDSAAAAAEFLATNRVDLVFLDIQMPGMTGIDFAATLDGNAMVIFTTAYSEYAADSYDVSAVDYLVKPIDPDRFAKAVKKAETYKSLLGSVAAGGEEQRLPVDRDCIIVRADRRFHRIAFDNILYASALKDYIIIHLPDRRVVTRLTMKELDDALPADRFMRVNKSFIVSIAAIDSFDTNDLYIGDTPVAIGANYRDAVLERLMR